MSLSLLQEVPNSKIVMLVGPPGAGKSTFCQQTVLHNLAVDRPIIYATTEYGTIEAEEALKKRGLNITSPTSLSYIDAYTQTVGLPVVDRPDTINVSSGNLTYLGIAISKHQRTAGKKGILLVFDSLTSPYLLCGSDVVRFFRLFLSKFAGDGNSVLACFDEGSGREEDVIGMMSISNGLVKVRVDDGNRIFNVIKHPQMKPTKIKIPLTPTIPGGKPSIDLDYFRQNVQFNIGSSRISLRKEVGDYVNIAWCDLIFWSGMLWDPKRFPKVMYDWIKFHYNLKNWRNWRRDNRRENISLVPWRKKLAYKLFLPKSLSEVKSMKKLRRFWKRNQLVFKHGKTEYLESVSRTNEHHFRIYESYECWGFENVGSPLAIVRPAMMAASMDNLETEDKDWNIVHTKCIGSGHPYCEHKAVLGQNDELKASLEKDNSIIEKINERLMDYITDFLVLGKPLMERPTLGCDVHMHLLQRITNAPVTVRDLQQITDVPISTEKLQLVFRMGGARSGKSLGEHLMDSGLAEEEAIKKGLELIDRCKAGKITLDETLRIYENVERFGFRSREPSCYFTTGFLNGLFYVVKNQHLRETKCIGTGDPYCEWEFR